MSTDKRRIAKNTLFLYIRMLLVMVVSVYTSRVILRSLGASDYGVYNVVGGIVQLFAFLNGALSSATTRFITFALGKGDNEKLRNTFAAALNLHVIVAIVVVILGETLGLWFLYNELVIPNGRMDAAFWILQFSLITCCINFTQIPFNASIVAHEKMSIYALVGLYDAFSKLIIAYLIQISPIDRLVFYGMLLMLNSAVVQLFYRFYTKRHYKECKFKLFYDKKLYGDLISYGGWELFGGVATACQGQGINILLNKFFGPVVNAARAIAFQIQTAIYSFIANFQTASKPQIIKRFAEKDYEGMYNLTFKTAKFSYFLMLALILPVCFEINFILKIWLVDVPKYTNYFAVIVLLTYLLMTPDTACMLAFHSIGKIKVGNVVGGLLMISALPISYIFLKLGYPPYSVYIVILVIQLTMQLIDWYLTHHYVRFPWRNLIKEVYIPCVLVSLMGCVAPIILHIFMTSGWLRFFMLFMSSEIILLLLIWIVGLNNSERDMVKSFVASKIQKNIFKR